MSNSYTVFGCELQATLHEHADLMKACLSLPALTTTLLSFTTDTTSTAKKPGWVCDQQQ